MKTNAMTKTSFYRAIFDPSAKDYFRCDVRRGYKVCYMLADGYLEIVYAKKDKDELEGGSWYATELLTGMRCDRGSKKTRAELIDAMENIDLLHKILECRDKCKHYAEEWASAHESI